MAAYIHREPYLGEERLVVALDIGATQTAVAYTHLVPGDLPEVQMVTSWPGQPAATGDAKIPTMVAYQDGHPKAFGAEAEEYVNDANYQIAKWFKLRLHPPEIRNPSTERPPGFVITSLSTLIRRWGANTGERRQTLARHADLPSTRAQSTSTMEIPPLPENVMLDEIYVNFLRYLYTNTRKYFERDTGDGVWNRLKHDSKLLVIMATPNGWNVTQHGFLRDAAITAGWITAKNSESCLSFVTEAEASVHFALAHRRSNLLSKGNQTLVVDAGGSTVDSALYECQSIAPKLILKEVCASECVQAGGIFVDRAMESLLEKKLRRSNKYGTMECLRDMLNVFEKTTKRLLNPLNFIRFGSSRDNDPSNGIENGQISLSDIEMSSAFNHSVVRTVRSCRNLLRNHRVTYVILVGGFGESVYL